MVRLVEFCAARGGVAPPQLRHERRARARVRGRPPPSPLPRLAKRSAARGRAAAEPERTFGATMLRRSQDRERIQARRSCLLFTALPACPRSCIQRSGLLPGRTSKAAQLTASTMGVTMVTR
eukprot:gene23212-biopygen2824